MQSSFFPLQFKRLFFFCKSISKSNKIMMTSQIMCICLCMLNPIYNLSNFPGTICIFFWSTYTLLNPRYIYIKAHSSQEAEFKMMQKSLFSSGTKRNLHGLLLGAVKNFQGILKFSWRIAQMQLGFWAWPAQLWSGKTFSPPQNPSFLFLSPNPPLALLTHDGTMHSSSQTSWSLLFGR